jgi:eukaryotic-like serine/threonine-protein kinase
VPDSTPAGVHTDPAPGPGRPASNTSGNRPAREPDPTDPNLTAVPPTEELSAVPLAAPVRTTLHPGVLLDGRYQLRRHISARGDVQLWQGEDQVLARPVAIRLIIDTGLPTALEGIDQLLAAARRSGQLIHNSAASTYDATTTSADGMPLAYVVSEWVLGISLLDLLRDGPLLPERAASVLLSVAKVVAAAHAVGVTHGDLHPGDVVITSHGLIKVLDLEMRAAFGERSAAEREARDVIGLGALLYASLTGRWPLDAGRGLPAAERDHNGACRSPRQLRAGVPRELDSLAMAALGSAAGPHSVGESPDELQPSSQRSRPAASEMVDALQMIVAMLPTGSQPALDDDPEAYTPAGQTAKAAQAERMARETEARRRTIRRRVLPVTLLVVLALAAWLVGVAVGKLPGHSGGAPAVGSSASATPSGTVLKLASVVDFDPQGDGQEDPSGVPFAYDNNLGTAWSTEIYSGSPWGGLPKTGVGLKVDLGKPVAVSQVRLVFDQPGVRVELRYSKNDAASQDAYTVAATSGPSPRISQVLSPRAGAYRYWLVWLTELPRQSTAGEATYSAALAEMRFYG